MRLGSSRVGSAELLTTSALLGTGLAVAESHHSTVQLVPGFQGAQCGLGSLSVANSVETWALPLNHSFIESHQGLTT